MNIQAAIAVALVTAGFGAGWQVATWRHDSIELAVQSLAEQHRQQTAAAMSEISRQAAEAISQIRVENRTVYQQATKEIIREPIYNDCVVPADGSRLLNEARAAGNDRLSADDAVPADTDDPEPE